MQTDEEERRTSGCTERRDGVLDFIFNATGAASLIRVIRLHNGMGILSKLFNKPEPPEPYDWPFLRQNCLQAIESRVAPAELVKDQLGGLDYDRLTASGDAAEDVVVEIWAVLKDAKTPELSSIQAQEYLYEAAEMLRTTTSAEAAATRLKEIEENVRKK